MTLTFIQLAKTIIDIIEQRDTIALNTTDERLHHARLSINSAYKNGLITRHQCDALNHMANCV